MTSDRSKLASVLSELKAEYLEKLPSKIEKIRLLTEKGSWTEIEDEYHKLKGTGRTYGFPEISILCEKMEILAQHPKTQNQNAFRDAVTVLERINAHYSQGSEFDLKTDALAQSLLALAVK